MYSNKYKNWIAILDLRTCLECRSRHGKIYLAEETISPKPPIHRYCRCDIKRVKALLAGTATKNKSNGADWWLKTLGKLPDYYITLSDAKNLGYNPYLGNLSSVAPNKMLTKGIYHNRNKHLPDAPGRVWYEADINYSSGYRGTERILYSNDGLTFITYDHYKTFQVVI